jgi:hypothetical protein
MSLDEDAFTQHADSFRGSVERALKRAYALCPAELNNSQHALALISGALTAAVAEAARLQLAPDQAAVDLLPILHTQVDYAFADAARLLSLGAA